MLINSMLMIVFSHRYCKGDVFIKEAINSDEEYMDFSIMRDVMYKYSKKAQDRFFSHPIEAFFFIAFSLSDDGLKFLESKPNIAEDPLKMQRLKHDLDELKKQAIASLQDHSKQQTGGSSSYKLAGQL